jgi:hypothetical protein
MNQQQIEQYVSGRMSESEAQAFEDHCVAHPEFAKQVELEQRLKAGLAQVARGSTAEFVRADQPRRWQMAAAAAGIALTLFAMFQAWNRFLPRTPAPVLAAVTADTGRDGESLRLALVRGVSGRPELQSGLVRVEIAGLFDTGSHYSIALDRIDQTKNIDTVATLHGVRPSSPVALEVMIDSDQLPTGSYSLRVRKQTSIDEPLDFEFLRN